MVNDILIEVCCGSVDDCVIAERCGADRIELNHALELGGMTPSIATLKRAKELVSIPICCMVRPRGFGFCYSEEHFRVMKLEAQELLENGADGIVFGFLKEDSSIDAERTKEMVNLIHPKEAVFHKALDATENIFDSIETLIQCGIDRVLTSGKGVYPDLDLDVLAQLERDYGDRIQILPGGGVRVHNVQSILKNTKVHQIHMTAKHLVLDASTWNTSDQKDSNAHSYVATDEKQLHSIIEKIKQLHQED